MEIKDFIEKAIQGGYKGRGIASNGSWFGDSVFLIPAVWQAVGKVEGWGKLPPKTIEASGSKYVEEQERFILDKAVHQRMHRMIDALAEGKTISEFLKTL